MDSTTCDKCGYPTENGAGGVRCLNPHHPVRAACTNCGSTDVHILVWDEHAECPACAALFNIVDATPAEPGAEAP